MAASPSTGAGRHVCIVGAGIVGAATAYALARDGWQVTLVDAQPAPGLGESRANGAQLSYSYVEPLATPDALRALPGWLLSDDSPLRWRPRPEAAHLRWLAAFVAACRWREVHRTTAALLALSGLSRATLHRWLAEQPGMAARCLHAQPGKLVLYRDAGSRVSVERQIGFQRRLGCVQRVVDADECRALEPALGASAGAGGGDIAFGVWTADEEVIDTSLLAQALVEASGAARHFGAPAFAFEQRGGRIAALRLEGRTLEADAFVLAAGPACASLLQPLGWTPPIEPIRGYSVTLPVVNDAAAPRASVTDSARKLVYARLGPQLRIAGFAELCGADRRIDPRRIAALCDAVRATFPGACRFDDPQPWAGLRPATPGGRPLVGATRWPGLWLNAGHGALGLTLACGSAALIADEMSGRAKRIDDRPFTFAAQAA